MHAMRGSVWLTICALGAWIVLGLGACGVSSAGGSADASAQTTSSATAHGVTVTPTATTSSTSHGGSSGVILTTGKSRYATGDVLEVTIQNALSAPVYLADTHTECTAVTLERDASGSWQVVAPCVNAYPHPSLVEVAPGASVTAQLRPSQDVSGGTAWSPGTYRVSLAYLTSPNQSAGQAAVVYSATFTIG